ncbi:glutamine--fructose-6-phosphate transaminase (isomerizing) [Pseudohalioglobus sediminis]|uniref:Glutamine--fructose-6-phosphate aminotransferase [isomerizing] n=1 Tax=Pseudohalioglobus sediminis TaxID=2606449 RepID=A0A5B0WWI2_9GAMM|nr:glutamine--fructose-6-phosphate transaminase (isomerizing) [Pseudohalioglobus sediminis]KAA1190501.1 glutamine--fructose-6-phosphate transaminase (isomerizing) [Pseudohalioglobus sediminis]
MCGIVAAAARREVSEILLEGLRRLEYRGYDSAGMALLDNEGNLLLHKQLGKVSELERVQALQPHYGCTGIAHTRWATHGEPSAANAHPHISGDRLALVHNGIIENHATLRDELKAAGYDFASSTDTEVIVHLLHYYLQQGLDLLEALRQAVARLEGAYAIAAVDADHPDQVVAARQGSPLVIGVGIGENFLASDQMALRQVTDRFIYLEEGDMALISPSSLQVFDQQGEAVSREQTRIDEVVESVDLGGYDHYMLKEIYEQPRALAATFSAGAGLLSDDACFGDNAADIFDRVRNVQIVACGTSYHAGMVGRYWLEELAGIPCEVEVASEFRYRKRVQHEGTLLLTISQSGETADTLAALRNAAPGEFVGSMVIANVDNSSLVRESDLVFLTRAGAEIGVASTKAFTTQLVALLMLTIALGRRGGMEPETQRELVNALQRLPDYVQETLELDTNIEALSEAFIPKHHALFLGRGIQYPIAMEGALKLKEISYIHAEAYPAGELKHGPLALVDDDMPVIAVAPGDELLEKLKSNLEEVRSRGGELFVFADRAAGFESEPRVRVLNMPHCPEAMKPVIYTVALQLLSYHVAVQKGTDVDKPRNLAKSVTVE